MLAKANARRAEVRARMNRLLGPGDVLCLPTSPRAAPPLGTPVDKIEIEYRNQAMCLLCIAGLAGLPQPEREYLFALDELGRRWRYDFCWPAALVAVEVEGGVWTRGRHLRPTGFIGDVEKYNAAALLGWTVLRVTADHIDNGQAIAWVKEALAKRAESATESVTERER